MEDETRLELEKKINHTFSDPALLVRAVTHRSYVNEARTENLVHNERLEFLGDAVLELVVTDYLFHTYPKQPEGVLTSYRAALVNTEALAEVGSSLSLQDHILLSRGEAQGNERARNTIVADVVEAVIGALYLDGGYDVAKSFIEKYMLARIEAVLKTGSWIDAKSRLQELAQEHLSLTPEYRMISAEGPDHDKVFTMGVYFNAQLVTKGSGNSKQEAEQEAARRAIEQNGWQLSL